jgi:hypothetical protein
MGEIFRFKNLKFKIWSNDHEPPHVHVHAPEAHAKVNLDTLEIMYSKGFSEKDLKIIQQQVFIRRVKIQEKWEEIHVKN